MAPGTALVWGTGLIGGSIALALSAAKWDVRVADRDETKTRQVAENLQLRQLSEDFDPDCVVIATPPSSVALSIKELIRLYPESTFIDVASVKNKVINDVETDLGKLSNFVPSHPMAGKETSGSLSASFDLMLDRRWIVTPLSYTDPKHIEAAENLIVDCGATPLLSSPDVHDSAVAVTSHLPQILASGLASMLLGKDPQEVSMSGGGLRDMTRLAKSAPDLWEQILLSNKLQVVESLDVFIDKLTSIKNALASNKHVAVREFIAAGNEALGLLPGKHGDTTRDLDVVGVMIDDKPGQLAELFSVLAQISLNIEDVRINHALGREIAIVELYVAQGDGDIARNHLNQRGWMIRH